MVIKAGGGTRQGFGRVNKTIAEHQGRPLTCTIIPPPIPFYRPYELRCNWFKDHDTIPRTSEDVVFLSAIDLIYTRFVCMWSFIAVLSYCDDGYTTTRLRTVVGVRYFGFRRDRYYLLLLTTTYVQ